jgi:hypothetical protein
VGPAPQSPRAPVSHHVPSTRQSPPVTWLTGEINPSSFWTNIIGTVQHRAVLPSTYGTQQVSPSLVPKNCRPRSARALRRSKNALASRSHLALHASTMSSRGWHPGASFSATAIGSHDSFNSTRATIADPLVTSRISIFFCLRGAAMKVQASVLCMEASQNLSSMTCGSG